MIKSASFLRFVSTSNRKYALGVRNMSSRSYKDAIEHLNTLQSNAAALEAARISGGKHTALAIPEMLENLRKIGYSVRFCVNLWFH
jgi:hypothetical protein